MKLNREVALGQLFAIASMLQEKIYEKEHISLSETEKTARYIKKPLEELNKIYDELLQYQSKFNDNELQLLSLFDEVLASIPMNDFTNEPLTARTHLVYYPTKHVLNDAIGVDEAATLWGLSPGTIKNYCAEGKIKCKKIGKTWVIDKNQFNPSKSS